MEQSLTSFLEPKDEKQNCRLMDLTNDNGATKTFSLSLALSIFLTYFLSAILSIAFIVPML